MEAAAKELYDLAWDSLSSAVSNRKHAFRAATLATISNGQPSLRIVTLRYASENQIGCHADIRSPKAIECREQRFSSWLFYSFSDKLQLRISGTTRVHHMDAVAEEAWSKSQLLARRCYLAPLAPSDLCDPEFANLPAGLEQREPTEEESEQGFANFSVIRTNVETLDVLSLAFQGGRRCRFTADGHEWLAP